jgi:serine/threonine-protein kinase
MAPEQAEEALDAIDERTDVYGIGAILFYILTGEPPHVGDSVTAVMADVREGKARTHILDDPSLPAGVVDIVVKALEADPGDRYPTALALREALEHFLFAGEWFSRRRFSAGELILREGERGGGAFIIEEGRCDIYRNTDSGSLHIRTLDRGEVVGELALFTGVARTASVVARTDVTLLEITREALEREMPEGSWMRQLIDTVARRFLQGEQQRREIEDSS